MSGTNGYGESSVQLANPRSPGESSVQQANHGSPGRMAGVCVSGFPWVLKSPEI